MEELRRREFISICGILFRLEIGCVGFIGLGVLTRNWMRRDGLLFVIVTKNYENRETGEGAVGFVLKENGKLG